MEPAHLIAAIAAAAGFVIGALIAMAETSRREIEEWQDEADFGDLPHLSDWGCDHHHGGGNSAGER